MPSEHDIALRAAPASGGGQPDGDRLLAQLARMLHEAGTPAQRIEGLVSACADRLGVSVSIFSLPTWINISVEDRRPGSDGIQRTMNFRVDPGAPKLALLEETHRVADRFISGELDAAGALTELERVRAERWKPNLAAASIGYALFSCGAARFLGGGAAEMVASIPVGLAVGLAIGFARGRRERELLSEFGGSMIAAVMAACTVVLFARLGWTASLPIVSLAGLVTLLPGLALATAMSELSTRNLASGSARLIGAATTLVVLGMGVAIGERAVQALGLVTPEVLRPVSRGAAVLDLGTAFAIAAIAVGLAIAFHARPRRFAIVLLSCIVGWGAAQVARLAAGDEFAPFFAALFIGIVGSIYARLRRRPTLAIVLPGLALLLPGSIGFRGVQGLLASDPVGGLSTAVAALTAAAAIAAGLLVANALLPSPRHV
jgi:uncharacterized membrane protein YjjP (DUF1212 family)